jgi:FkbM family methyltransferase
MQKDLIFDIGAHRGEDTEFYLKKGFRTVAVEADPDLADSIRKRFPTDLAEGRLTVVPKAIAKEAGTILLYKNTTKAIWNTIDTNFAERNRRTGNESVAVSIEAITMEELLKAQGVPYYAKIDIEGVDRVALAAFGKLADRPPYISIESEKDSFRELRRDFELFLDLGYDRFKISPQLSVASQREPTPPREGVYSGHQFQPGSSGLFGEELPGPWVSAVEAIEAYKPIFMRYMLTGDDPLIRNKWVRRILKRSGFRAGWHDLHAKHRLREGP